MNNNDSLLGIIFLCLCTFLFVCCSCFICGSHYNNAKFEQRCVDNGVGKRIVDEKGYVHFEFIKDNN